MLIAALGTPDALWADAASFVVSAVIIALVVPNVRAPIRQTGMLDGLRFVTGAPKLRTFFVIWTAGAFLIAPLATVVLPVYAGQVLGGAADLAAAITAYGLGGLAGTVTYGLAGRRIPRRLFFVIMWTAYPALSFGLVLLPPLAGLVALLFLIGMITGAYDPFEVTIHQELITPELRARAFAVLIAAEMTVVPIAMLLYGLLIESVGLRIALIVCAIGNALLGAYAVLSRWTRQLAPTDSATPARH